MKLSWGYIITFGYIAFVGGIGFLVYKATNEKFDLVTKDYYEEELKYQQVIDQSANTARLSAPLIIEKGHQELKVSFPSEMKGMKKIIEFYLYYPANAKKDFRKKIEMDQNELTQALPIGMKGMYVLKLTWEANDIKYYHEQKLFL